MWQQRVKAWLDSIRARFARRGERTTHSDIEAYESRHEAGVVGTRRGFDLRRSALPITIGTIALLSAVALNDKLAARWPLTVQAVDGAGPLARHLGAAPGNFVLVRPDAYVAAQLASAAPAEIEAALRRALSLEETA